MEFEIIEEKENPLFKRKEIQVNLDAQTTPSRNEMTESIAQKFSTQPENISLKGIHGRFGSKNFIINANIYSSKEEKEKTEPKRKKNQTPQTESQEQTHAESQSDSENKELINKENSEPSGEANQTENA